MNARGLFPEIGLPLIDICSRGDREHRFAVQRRCFGQPNRDRADQVRDRVRQPAVVHPWRSGGGAHGIDQALQVHHHRLEVTIQLLERADGAALAARQGVEANPLFGVGQGFVDLVEICPDGADNPGECVRLFGRESIDDHGGQLIDQLG